MYFYLIYKRFSNKIILNYTYLSTYVHETKANPCYQRIYKVIIVIKYILYKK